MPVIYSDHLSMRIRARRNALPEMYLAGLLVKVDDHLSNSSSGF